MSKTKKYLQDFAGNLAQAMIKNGTNWDCIFKRNSMPYFFVSLTKNANTPP